MFKQLIFFYYSLLVLMQLIACKGNNQDNIKPIIDIVSPDELNVHHIYSDEEFSTEVLFRDNKELNQYKFRCNSKFDQIISPDNAISKAKTFSVTIVKNLRGKEQLETISFHFDKHSISGKYQILIDCIDASGNQAQTATIPIYVKNKFDTLAPEIKIISPVNGSQYAKDSTIILGLLLEDYRSSNEYGFIYDYTIDIFRTSDSLKVYSINQTVNKTSFYSLYQKLPVITNAGEYQISVTSRDDFNNQSQAISYFHLN